MYLQDVQKGFTVIYIAEDMAIGELIAVVGLFASLFACSFSRRTQSAGQRWCFLRCIAQALRFRLYLAIFFDFDPIPRYFQETSGASAEEEEEQELDASTQLGAVSRVGSVTAPSESNISATAVSFSLLSW